MKRDQALQEDGIGAVNIHTVSGPYVVVTIIGLVRGFVPSSIIRGNPEKAVDQQAY